VLVNGDIDFGDVCSCEMVWRRRSFKAWGMGKFKAWAKRIAREGSKRSNVNKM
jgi:hypothetical protein